MKLALTNRAKVLAGVVVLIGAAAAAWFLYGEEWLAGPPAPPPMAAKPKPAAPVAKAPEAPAPEAPKPAAEAPKPAPEAPKPAVAEAPKPGPVKVAQAPAAPKDETVKPKRTAKKRDDTQAKALAREAAAQPIAAKEPAPAKAPDMTPIPAPIPVQSAPAPAETAVTPPPAPVQVAAAAPAPAAAPATPGVASAPVVGALRFNDLVTAVLYRDPEAVNALLAFGKWPDKGDSRGMTPLMYAAMLGDAPIAESLLRAGANPNQIGPGGDTAMSIARDRQDSGMQTLLQRHGAR